MYSVCRKCGKECPDDEIRGHVRWCKSTAKFIPDDKDLCRKCKKLITRNQRHQHEATCRGSQEANHTCLVCGYIFPIPPGAPPGLSRSVVSHEWRCTGQQPMVEPGPPIPQAKAKPKAKAKAKAKLHARAKTANAKAKAKAKAKVKAKAKAWLHRRLRGNQG